jgi:cytochrome c oxidase subunit IV
MGTTEHITAPGAYRKVLGTLLALTIITVLAAGVNFGAGNVVIALVIASIKASLVALFFMHLRHDKPMSAVILVSGLAMLGIFLIFCIVDTGARGQLRPPYSRPAVHLVQPPAR